MTLLSIPKGVILTGDPCTSDLLLSFAETICGYYEKKLLGDLMRPYNYLERPVVNESEPLMLTFGITLQQIIDVVSALHEHEMTPSPRRVSGGQFNRH